MRITDVRAVHPRTPLDPPDWRSTVGQILVVVETDGDVHGYGVGGGGPAGTYLIDTLLRPLLLDRDPQDAEQLWEQMYRATRAFGRSGLVMMAISGVDNALWDAWAKAEQRSVAGLLAWLDGAALRTTRIPAYATTPRPADAVQQGFRAVKLHLGPDVEAAIRLVLETRRLIGENVELFTDAWEQWDLAGSLRAAAAFADYGVGWLEEPLPTEERDAYAELARHAAVPLAGGEHEYTARAFRELAGQGALRVWQPDATWVGGMTQLRAIYKLAAQSGARVVPHRGGEVWGLHAIAVLDPNPLAESPRPWITWLQGQPAIERGYVKLPDRPGFGVEPAPGLAGI